MHSKKVGKVKNSTVGKMSLPKGNKDGVSRAVNTSSSGKGNTKSMSGKKGNKFMPKNSY